MLRAYSGAVIWQQWVGRLPKKKGKTMERFVKIEEAIPRPLLENNEEAVWRLIRSGTLPIYDEACNRLPPEVIDGLYADERKALIGEHPVEGKEGAEAKRSAIANVFKHLMVKPDDLAFLLGLSFVSPPLTHPAFHQLLGLPLATDTSPRAPPSPPPSPPDRTAGTKKKRPPSKPKKTPNGKTSGGPPEKKDPNGKTSGGPPEKKEEVVFGVALLLAMGIALLFWLFPPENRSYDPLSILSIFLAACIFLLTFLGYAEKLSRRRVYVLFGVVLSSMLILLFAPKRIWAENWEDVFTLSNGFSSEDGVHTDGVLNLSRARSLRLTLDSVQAGTEFQWRLLPKGTNSDTSWKMGRIPGEGVVMLPVKAADFGLTPEDMEQLWVQIALLPKRENTKHVSDVHTVLKKMEILTGEAEPNLRRQTPGWRVLPNTLPPQTWTNEEAYSMYVDGWFNLSTDSFIRITFDAEQVGTKFFLRLLPQDANTDQPVGVRREILRIPESAVLTLHLKASKFGLTPQAMGQLTQVSVHSGSNAWSRPLEQDADKHARFQKIETQ